MSANQTDSSAIPNLLTAIAALSAVVLAILTEVRAQKRFRQDVELQSRIASADIRSMLNVEDHLGDKGRKVILLNEGLGPAVITSMTFSKDDRHGTSLPSILNIATKFGWNDFCTFEQACSIRARYYGTSVFDKR